MLQSNFPIQFNPLNLENFMYFYFDVPDLYLTSFHTLKHTLSYTLGLARIHLH